MARVRDADSGIDAQNVSVTVNGDRVSNAVRRYIPGKSGKPWDWYFYEKAIVLYDPLQGEVRYVPAEPLPEGKNHVSVEVLDRQGNRSARTEAVFEVVIDKEPPQIADFAPPHRAVLAKPTVVLSARLTDTGKSGLDLDTLRLTVDGQDVPLGPDRVQFDAATGRLTLPLPQPLSRDAQHALTLTVRDRAGNVSPPATSVVSIVKDGDPPRVDVLSPARAAAAGEPVLFAAALYDVGRSGLDPASVALTLDGKPVPSKDPEKAGADGYLLADGLVTYRLEQPPRGRHVLSLTVRDKAGNRATEAVWPFEVK
jgi:hypothetical protein